tara:strand:+ start:264 stop:731 length:468 start_codon:yes stop_codon:yes gene_type:complete
MNNISKLFTTIFNIGFIKYSPGTIGSIFSCFIIYSLYKFTNFYFFFFLFFIIFILSIYFIKNYIEYNKLNDPKEIIIDEFLGIYLVFLFYDQFDQINTILKFILIIVFFRFFDIFKIFPANIIDIKMKNSLGIILDDIVAAIYTIITLYIFNEII